MLKNKKTMKKVLQFMIAALLMFAVVGAVYAYDPIYDGFDDYVDCPLEGEYTLNKDNSILVGSKNIRINNVNAIGNTGRIGATIAVTDGEAYDYASLFRCEGRNIGGVLVKINDFYFDGTDLGRNSWVKFTIYNENDFEIPSEPSCNDNDGNNIYTKGFVDGGLNPISNEQMDFVDSCAASASNNEYRFTSLYVVENTCQGNYVHSTRLACPEGYSCSDGACIERPEPEPLCEGQSVYEIDGKPFTLNLGAETNVKDTLTMSYDGAAIAEDGKRISQTTVYSNTKYFMEPGDKIYLEAADGWQEVRMVKAADDNRDGSNECVFAINGGEYAYNPRSGSSYPDKQYPGIWMDMLQADKDNQVCKLDFSPKMGLASDSRIIVEITKMTGGGIIDSIKEYRISGANIPSFCKVEPVPEPTPLPELKCGDSYGGDGYYSACKGDTIKHTTKISLKAVAFAKDYLVLRVVETGENLRFDRQKETIKFRYKGIDYKVEYNYFEPGGRATIYITHGSTGQSITPAPVDKIEVIGREEVKETKPVPIPTPKTCENGCQSNGNCLPYGTRVIKEGTSTPSYCGIDGELHKQQKVESSCQNNYECSSNQCSNGRCVDISEQIEETQSFLEKIFDWLKRLFG